MILVHDHIDSQVRPEDVVDTSQASVSIVIPALNEEKTLGRTLRYLKLLEPQPYEVIVVDGGSTDRTRDIAAALGAKVVRSSRKGRAVQQNLGAENARGDTIVFLHADTLPPVDLVRNVRDTFRDRRTVMGCFTPLLTLPDRTLIFMSVHNTVKTYYIPLLMKPISYSFGLRCPFGDQCLFVRRADFEAVGGFDASIPIMEDTALAFALHAHGPSSKLRQSERGRIRMLSKTVDTSGRRIEKLGNLKATFVHFMIGLSWFFGGSTPEGKRRLQHLYDNLYGDDHARAR